MCCKAGPCLLLPSMQHCSDWAGLCSSICLLLLGRQECMSCVMQSKDADMSATDGPNGGFQMAGGAGEANAAHYLPQVCYMPCPSLSGISTSPVNVVFTA